MVRPWELGAALIEDVSDTRVDRRIEIADVLVVAAAVIKVQNICAAYFIDTYAYQLAINIIKYCTDESNNNDAEASTKVLSDSSLPLSDGVIVLLYLRATW